MTDNAILATHLYLPGKDRSFWQREKEEQSPLLYLAWGSRDFHKEHIPIACHQGWTCILIQEGQPTLQFEHEEIILTAGALLVIGPDCAFGWSRKANSKCRFLLWMWKDFQPDRQLRIHRQLNLRDRKIFQQVHDSCRHEVLKPDAVSKRCLDGYQIVFSALVQRTFFADEEKAAQIVKQATSWMKQHLDSHKPIARVCDYLSLSQSSLHRVFKLDLDVSPTQHFQQLKMEQAKHLLQKSKLSVKAIALTLGYRHSNDFSRAFKKYFQHSPVQCMRTRN